MTPEVNSLYILPLKVSRAIRSDWATASVNCFVAAANLPSAISEATYRLSREKYLIVDFSSDQVEQIDLKAWSTFIASRYPNVLDHFPSKAEFVRIIAAEGIFLGPFSNWEIET